MTTMYYEERLRAFAEGKRLGRLTKGVGAPEECGCEAPRCNPTEALFMYCGMAKSH